MYPAFLLCEIVPNPDISVKCLMRTTCQGESGSELHIPLSLHGSRTFFGGPVVWRPDMSERWPAGRNQPKRLRYSAKRIYKTKTPFAFSFCPPQFGYLPSSCRCFPITRPLPTREGEHMLTLRCLKHIFCSAHAAPWVSVTHSEESAVSPLLHTWAHRCTGLAT